MVPESKHAGRRFARTAFRGRCRRRLLSGLALMALAVSYGAYAGYQLGQRGAERAAFDRPLARLARTLNPAPRHLGTIWPENSRELYMVTVISDQQDVLEGLTLLILRSIVVLTAGGIGIVLVAGGSTEWEVRSERAAVGHPAPAVVSAGWSPGTVIASTTPGRGIPVGGVAPPSDRPAIFGRRAWPPGRRAPGLIPGITDPGD